MADEAPRESLFKLVPRAVRRRIGFNLVTERVVSVNPETKQLEVELLAYDGKTVVLDVVRGGTGGFSQHLKPGDGATIAWSKRGVRRIAKGFRIRAKGSECGPKPDAMLLGSERLAIGSTVNMPPRCWRELKGMQASVGPLVEALMDEVGDVRQRAYDSLIKMGGPAVSSLMPLLVSEEDELRTIRDGNYS